MSIFSRLFSSSPKPEPRRVPGAFVAAALATKLHCRSDYQHYGQKATMALPTPEDVALVVDAAWMPWKENVWECEDQARAVVHEAQKRAAKQGCSWAIGTLRAQPPAHLPQDSRHVYVWALCQAFAGMSPGVLIYDPTARKAVAVSSLREVDYTMT